MELAEKQESPSVESPRRVSSARALIRCLRPKQFVKNALIFAPGIFSGRTSSKWILDPQVFLSLFTTFLLFSLLAGSTYIINDYLDLDLDRKNPAKRNRPMAAGQISPRVALTFALVAIPSVLAFQTFFRNWRVGAAFLVYLVLTLFYSFVLKHLVIFDIMTIATLFILRSYIGCLDLEVPISMWFLSCVGSLAMFIAVVKRHHELGLVQKAVVSSADARAVIAEYNEPLVFMIMTLSTMGALLTYVFFAVNEAPSGFGYSIPFVVFGILRFLYLALVRGVGGTPELTLMRDRPLVVTVALWTMLLLFIYSHGGNVTPH